MVFLLSGLLLQAGVADASRFAECFGGWCRFPDELDVCDVLGSLVTEFTGELVKLVAEGDLGRYSIPLRCAPHFALDAGPGKGLSCGWLAVRRDGLHSRQCPS